MKRTEKSTEKRTEKKRNAVMGKRTARNRTTRQHTILMWLREYGISVLLFAAIMGLVLGSMPSIMENSRAEQLRMAEETLRRAVVSCYALEGRYPPDIDYLREEYGLQLSDERYIVHYEIFAENIMPEITVLER